MNRADRTPNHPPIRFTTGSDGQLVKRVCALISRTLQVSPDLQPLGLETRLYGAGLGVDSVDTLRLVAALEEEFGLVIEDADLTPSTFADVGAIVALVRKRTP